MRRPLLIIDGDSFAHRARVFALVKSKQEISKAQNRSGSLVAMAAYRFWQGVIGAVGKGVAVDNEKRPPHELTD